MGNDIRRWLRFRPWERHSLVLLMGGLTYIFVGVALLGVEELTEQQELAWVIGLRIMPIGQWAAAYIAAGVLACISSTWPEFSDKWGYSVLTGLASAWSGIYILGWAMADAPISNVYTGLIWGLTAFLWWAISGLVNPDRRAVIRHERC